MAISKKASGKGTVLRPFQNESQSIEIGDLTIENRIDRVECYGSIALTRDKAGLAAALELKALVDAVVEILQSEELSDRITDADSKQVPNPFKAKG